MKSLRNKLRKARLAVGQWEEKHRDPTTGGMYFSGKDLSDQCFADLETVLNQCVHINKSRNVVTLLFDYPYEIELHRIPTPAALLSWVLHLSEKDWMEKDCLEVFIEKVADFKGWNVHGNH